METRTAFFDSEILTGFCCAERVQKTATVERIRRRDLKGIKFSFTIKIKNLDFLFKIFVKNEITC